MCPTHVRHGYRLPRWGTNQIRPFSMAKCASIIITMAKYSAEQLRQLLDEGHAMHNADGDPSYPIDDDEDLRHAIRAVGRGDKSPEAIRRYIRGRAKDMNKLEEIPETWKADGTLKD